MEWRETPEGGITKVHYAVEDDEVAASIEQMPYYWYATHHQLRVHKRFVTVDAAKKWLESRWQNK